MTIAHELIGRFANLTRHYHLQRFDPLIRIIHNPDKQKKRSIKKIILINNETLFSIDTSSYLEWTLFFYGEYEPFTQKLITSMVKPGSVALDIGANIGIHTITLAKATGPTGKVYSFEPHPTIFNKLITNISLNNLQWVHPIKTALTDTSGTAILCGFDHQTSNEGTSALGNKASEQPLQKNQFHVTTITLDDFVALHNITKLDIIKIDVEGHEINVFNGAIKTLTTLKPIIIFEDSAKNVIVENSPIRKLFNDLSYTLYAIHYNHLSELTHNHKGYNFLAVPPFNTNK